MVHLLGKLGDERLRCGKRRTETDPLFGEAHPDLAQERAFADAGLPLDKNAMPDVQGGEPSLQLGSAPDEDRIGLGCRLDQFVIAVNSACRRCHSSPP